MCMIDKLCLLTFLFAFVHANLCQSSTASLAQLIDQFYLSVKDYPMNLKEYRNVLSLRDQILQSEPKYDLFPAGETRKMAMDRFVPWAKKHFIIDGIDIVWNEKFGASTIASKKITPHQELIRVPSEKTINTMDIESKYECLSDVVADWDTHYLTWLSKTLVVETLAQAARNDSFFEPYIRTFPREYVLPMTFTADDFKALQGSVVRDSALYTTSTSYIMFSKYWKKLNSDPECAKRVGMPIEKFTLRWFLWAYAVVISRQYNGWFRSGDVNKVLVPVYDLMNHGEPSTTATNNIHKADTPGGVPTGDFVTTAVLPIQEGEEIWNGYSEQMDPLEAFDTYGFHQNNFYPLRIDLDKNDSKYPTRLRILTDYTDGQVIIGNPAKFKKLMHEDYSAPLN